jgi:hypothetical protein
MTFGTDVPSTVVFEQLHGILAVLYQKLGDRWLGWVEQAEPVPPDEQMALAERDLRMRRISAERDPGNGVAVKIFGAELANQLVQALWYQP